MARKKQTNKKQNIHPPSAPKPKRHTADTQENSFQCTSTISCSVLSSTSGASDKFLNWLGYICFPQPGLIRLQVLLSLRRSRPPLDSPLIFTGFFSLNLHVWHMNVCVCIAVLLVITSCFPFIQITNVFHDAEYIHITRCDDVKAILYLDHKGFSLCWKSPFGNLNDFSV